MSSMETPSARAEPPIDLWGLTLPSFLESVIGKSSLPYQPKQDLWRLATELAWSSPLPAAANRELRELLAVIMDALVRDSLSPGPTGQPSPSPKASPSPTSVPKDTALVAGIGVNSKTEWIVCCGSAGASPNPRFDNELDAITRYHEEISIPSYIGPKHRRRASVIKVTTITEDVIS